MNNIVLEKGGTLLLLKKINEEEHYRTLGMNGVYAVWLEAKDVANKMINDLCECYYFWDHTTQSVFIHLNYIGGREVFMFGILYFRRSFMTLFDDQNVDEKHKIDWRKEGF